MRERETFKARHHLLNMMRDLLRRRVGQLEADRDREQQLSVDGQYSVFVFWMVKDVLYFLYTWFVCACVLTGTSSAESFVDQGENRLSLSCKGRPHVKEKHRYTHLDTHTCSSAVPCHTDSCVKLSPFSTFLGSHCLSSAITVAALCP